MVTEDQILDFLILLERLKNAYESYNGPWEGYDFNFEHIDNRIEVETGWCSPEESGEYNFTVYLEDPIRVHTKDEEYTVYGDCDNEEEDTFDSLESYGKYLIEYFNVFEN